MQHQHYFTLWNSLSDNYFAFDSHKNMLQQHWIVIKAISSISNVATE